MRARGKAIVVVVVAGAAFAMASPEAPSHAGPVSRGAAESCATCHLAEAAAWHASAHATSWSNAVFQAAYRLEPKAFCRGCHAPLADPAHEPPALAAAAGVGCVACHARPHVEAVDRERVCARCHEFPFPGESPVARAPTLMQSTVREHLASGSSATCVECHMPEGGGARRDHGFVIDAAKLREGLAVDVRARRSEGRVIASFELASRAGHAVPTGDMMRRLELRVWIDGRPSESRELARRFGEVREGGHRIHVEASDDRVPADGRKAVRDVSIAAPPEARQLSFAVDRLRMPEEHARVQKIGDDVNRTRIVAGTVPID